MNRFLASSLFALFLIASCQTPTPPIPTPELTKLDTKTYPFYDRELLMEFPSKTLNTKAYIKAKKEIQKDILNITRSSAGFDKEWIVQGPGNIGARVTRVAVNPDNQDIIFAGYAGGGLWRTKDGGDNWESIFDAQIFNSIGDIAIDPENTDIIYIGTGDPNVPGRSFIGDGMYKSTDGGDTWTHIGLEEQRIISRVTIDPTDSNVLYAASMGLPYTRNDSRGLFKSTDGGENWTKTFYYSDSTGVTDLIVHPEQPDLLIMSTWDRVRNNKESIIRGDGSGIYRSTDGGETWSNPVGIPDTILNKTGIAICEGSPNNIYAITVGAESEIEAIYRSVDYGETFDEIPTDFLKNSEALGGFGWYFAKIAVNPNDPNHIFVLGVDLWHSKDNGETWEEASPIWWTYLVHADKHDLDIMPDGRMYLATDGGLYTNHLDQLPTEFNPFDESWVDIENIPTTQFYRVGYNPHEPDIYYGGAQDNGTTGGNENYINEWPRIFGGDGFQPTFNPDDPDHFYVETQNGGIRYTTDGGFDFNSADPDEQLDGNKNWDMPYIMSPHRPTTLYTGTEYVYKATDSYNPDWEQISPNLTLGGFESELSQSITSINESSVIPGIIYTGTSNGLVYNSLDDGSTWNLISADLPLRYITSVKASPTDPATAYVTLSGYRENEFIPRVYKTTDDGATWEDIAEGIPNVPVNDIYILPGYDDRILFIATTGGVYGSIDNGANWERLGINMPNLPTLDLEYNIANQEIVAATFGRSIMSYNISGLLDGILSVENLADHDLFKVYPSETSSIINLDIDPQLKDVNLTIYSTSGQKVGEYTGREPSLDVSHIQTGRYFIRLTSRNGQISRSFLKI